MEVTMSKEISGTFTETQLKKYISEDWEIIQIDDKDVIGQCETCRHPLVNGDKFTAYIEDIYLCENCDTDELNLGIRS